MRSAFESSAPPRPRTLRRIPRPQSVTGYTLFSLGPVYASLGIDWSILDRFSESKNIDSPSMEGAIDFITDRPFMHGVVGWEDVLQGLPTLLFTEEFDPWVASLRMTDSKKGVYSRIMRTWVPLGGGTSIAVYTPIGTQRCIIPRWSFLGRDILITMAAGPGDPDLRVEAAPFFEVMR